MKKLTYFIIFFLTNAILYITIAGIFSEYVDSNFYIGIWLLILIFALIGFLLSVFPYHKISDKKIFLDSSYKGYIVSSLLFVSFIFYFKYEAWFENKYYGNAIANNESIKSLLVGGDSFVPRAFKALESKFEDPNQISLNSFIVTKEFKVLKSERDTTHNVYFKYFLGNDLKKEYAAKVSVHNNRFDLIFLNQSAAINYKEIYKDEEFGFGDEASDDIASSFQKLSDSSRIVIIDTIKKVLSK